MAVEILAVKTDEASASLLAVQISGDIPDLQSVPTESQPEKVTFSCLTLADELVASTSALDAGSHQYLLLNQVRFMQRKTIWFFG